MYPSYNTLRGCGGGGGSYDERSPLLPFLAGVLVTTPFLFLNNNKNNYSQPYPVYPQPYPPMYPQPYPPMYPQPYPYR